jgi:hypothetical protein
MCFWLLNEMTTLG